MKTRLSAIAACIAFIVTGTTAWGQIPHTFSVQGLLTLDNGSPVSNGQHQVQFNIYTTAAGGAPIHTESQAMQINEGVVNAVLGLSTQFGSPVQFDHQYYLGIRIDGGAEMTPRTMITATPYAIRADMANHAGSADIATNAGSSNHATTADNANHALTADLAMDLSPSATSVVRSLNGMTGNLKVVGIGATTVWQSGDTLRVGSVDNTGITAVKSLDPAIGVANPNGPDVYLNLGGNSVRSFHITDGDIATVDMANAAITEPKIGPNAVPATKMSTATATIAGQVLTYDGTHATPIWSNMFVGDGGGLANLNAGSLATGTMSDARLSSNVALRNAANNFTGAVNTFKGIASEGVSINSAPGGKGLEITRGRTILAYGSVPSGNVIPSDISVANIGSNGSFTFATAGYPVSGEMGQIIYVSCDDPQGCRVIDMAAGNDAGASLPDLGQILLYHQVSIFVMTQSGWLRVN